MVAFPFLLVAFSADGLFYPMKKNRGLHKNGILGYIKWHPGVYKMASRGCLLENGILDVLKWHPIFHRGSTGAAL
jgi:hypothetical protein